PAMHTEMWEHPATRSNVAVLRERGAVVLEPTVGRLTGPDTGKGRRAAPPGRSVAGRRGGGAVVWEPPVGRLTGADTGKGRLPEPPEIYAAALALLRPADFAGRRGVVTAGG